MIVEWQRLSELAGQVTMVGGGFDPLHGGHVDYVAAAAGLGIPVLCNVEPDRYVEEKHPVLLPQAERGRILDAFRDVSYVHLSDTRTDAVLEQLRPRYFVKGSDWRGRLPAVEQDVCSNREIEVVFVDTVSNSSTTLVRDLIERSSAGGRP